MKIMMVKGMKKMMKTHVLRNVVQMNNIAINLNARVVWVILMPRSVPFAVQLVMTVLNVGMNKIHAEKLVHKETKTCGAIIIVMDA